MNERTRIAKFSQVYHLHSHHYITRDNYVHSTNTYYLLHTDWIYKPTPIEPNFSLRSLLSPLSVNYDFHVFILSQNSIVLGTFSLRNLYNQTEEPYRCASTTVWTIFQTPFKTDQLLRITLKNIKYATEVPWAEGRERLNLRRWRCKRGVDRTCSVGTHCGKVARVSATILAAWGWASRKCTVVSPRNLLHGLQGSLTEMYSWNHSICASWCFHVLTEGKGRESA